MIMKNPTQPAFPKPVSRDTPTEMVLGHVPNRPLPSRSFATQYADEQQTPLQPLQRVDYDMVLEVNHMDYNTVSQAERRFLPVSDDVER